MAQIVVILWVGPLLLGLGHYQASRNLARKRGDRGTEGPSGWARGLEKRQLSWNSVHTGSQRWSLLGDSRLGALGPLAQCVVMDSRARAKRTPASPRPARTPRPMWKR